VWPVYDSEPENSFINPNKTIHMLSGGPGDIEGMDPIIVKKKEKEKKRRKI